MTVEPTPTASRVVWLERLYDIVFVACVGRFANELGTNPDASHTVLVLGWLSGLWLAWLLVTVRLNRFPDERWSTRAVVVLQLMCTTVAVAAAVSKSSRDDAAGIVAAAGISLGVAALYAIVPRSSVSDVRVLVLPVAGCVAVGLSTLTALVLPRATAAVLTSAVVLVFLVAVLGSYLTRVARDQPVDARHAADRHAQLFLVLMGLSFLKVAFAADSATGVVFAAVLGAFLVGFSLWVIYIDGVLPLGFPSDASRQRTWLVAQFALALAITVAAAAVTAVPVTQSGAMTIEGALLEGGAFAAGLLAVGVLALSAEHPAVRLAFGWIAVATLVAAITMAGLIVVVPAKVFSWLVAGAVVLAAGIEVALGKASA